MVQVQRANLLDPMAPNPSVETLLHAFVPHKFVDHTHSTAILGIVDQPNSRELCDDLYNGRMGFVRYIMPGFGLAKESAAVFERDPKVEGLILDKHGIFTFGKDAREAYERMIEMVTIAEDRLKKNRKSVFVSAQMPQRAASLAQAAPILRGAVALPDPKNEGAWKRLIFDFRTNDAILNFVNGKDVKRYALAGVITPDHTIRTKDWPMIAPAPDGEKLADFRKAARDAAGGIRRTLQGLFRAQQQTLQRRQGDARSAPAHAARARSSACSGSAAPRRTRGSPPTSRKPRSRASPTPRRSENSRRSAKRHVRLRILVARSRPSSAPRRSRRSPARSR
jgi:rhamnose utilization protein RhaD (predicted bifunctional aldolase and dehydrogenase)